MKKIDIGKIKREVNLVEVAALYGYRINKQKTSQSSVNLKSDVDSLILKQDEDGHWVYFNVHNASDKGSILDFVLYRQPGLVFQEALRKINEDYFGKILAVPSEMRGMQVKPVKKNRKYILDQYNKMKNIQSSEYLMSRGIDNQIFQNKRFIGTVLEDHYHNIIFPHNDEAGVCGFEKRNVNFKGFPKGGTKSLWLSNRFRHDTRLMVVEGGIDALSHYVLFQDKSTRYLSIGGEPSPNAWSLAIKVIEKFHKQGGEIISGVDNDQGGDELDRKLRSKTTIVIKRERPIKNDWNEVLKDQLTVK